MYHPHRLKPATGVILIDFEGNQLLGEKELNDLRFSKLKELIFEHPIKDMVILSQDFQESGTHTRMMELKDEVKDRYCWLELPDKWADYDKDNPLNSIAWIKKEAKKAGWEIKNVILAGQNLSGCVWKTLDYSALRWAEQGHNVQIVLSMCGDYEIAGVGPEKYMKSFALLYQKIKKSGQWAMIDIISDIKEIKYMDNGELKCGE